MFNIKSVGRGKARHGPIIGQPAWCESLINAHVPVIGRSQSTQAKQ